MKRPPKRPTDITKAPPAYVVKSAEPPSPAAVLLGKRLRALRLACGWLPSREELAQRVNTTDRQLRRIEEGQAPTNELAAALASELGVSLDAIPDPVPADPTFDEATEATYWVTRTGDTTFDVALIEGHVDETASDLGKLVDARYPSMSNSAFDWTTPVALLVTTRNFVSRYTAANYNVGIRHEWIERDGCVFGDGEGMGFTAKVEFESKDEADRFWDRYREGSGAVRTENGEWPAS